jgi:hypothetical protein
LVLFIESVLAFFTADTAFEVELALAHLFLPFYPFIFSSDYDQHMAERQRDQKCRGKCPQASFKQNFEPMEMFDLSQHWD